MKTKFIGTVFYKAQEPNQIWLSDLTYIKTKEGWLFLGMILDLYTRKIVGYKMGTKPNSQLVIEAIKNAILIQKPKKGLILHTYRGIQYTSEETMKICRKHRIIRLYSAPGCPYDNALMESFFATLKKEKVRHRKYPSIKEAKISIFEYIAVFYNLRRKHSDLNYKSPQQFIQSLAKSC
ncbi:MAG: IS3 family transposase [Brevinema sp.]